MSRDQDVDTNPPLTDADRPLGGAHPDSSSLPPPVSPFTTAAHRLTRDTQIDERPEGR
jgi:hypothetical protein